MKTAADILVWMTVNRCGVFVGKGDHGQVEFEVTPDTFNLAFAGFGDTVKDAAVNAIFLNTGELWEVSE